MLRRLNLYKFYLRGLCYVLPAIAFLLAAFSRFYLQPWLGAVQQYSLPEYVFLLAFLTMAWAMASEHYGITSVEELFVERTGVRAALKASGATYMLCFAVLFFYRTAMFSRAFFLLSSVWLLLLVVALRAAFRLIVCTEGRQHRPLRLLIVGTDTFSRRAIARLKRSSFQCEVVAYLRLPGEDTVVRDAPVHDLSEINELQLSGAVDDIVLAVPPDRFIEIPAIMSALKNLSMPTRVVVDLGQGVIIRDKLFQVGQLHMLDLGTTPAESMSYLLIKRAFDIAFSSLVILLSLPLTVLIAILIKLTSKGPIFFVQERVGLNGRVFPMFKFRTMRVSAPSESDRLWTTEDDPRKTPFGALLRKTSLDELPQFLNVLTGDMSIVGPRPERPHFVETFMNEVSQYGDRHRLKVGITGWAQVNGWRGDTSIEKRVECDLYYLQNWSFGLDMRIILMTVWTGLFGKNAY
ncbi:MAG TPA: undecaprenyl-phosphate glucose phosphotransferase [Clostridia bacterium]|nr:undecaprenyl-phosphate glucose phosphotransferase [Clostridia bacterium]